MYICSCKLVLKFPSGLILLSLFQPFLVFIRFSHEKNGSHSESLEFCMKQVRHVKENSQGTRTVNVNVRESKIIEMPSIIFAFVVSQLII